MNKSTRSSAIGFFLIFVLTFGSLPQVEADTDIVGGASEDIAGGASVFVFRGSKKAPHPRKSAQAKFTFKRTNQQKSAQYAKLRTNLKNNTARNRSRGTRQTNPSNPKDQNNQVARNTRTSNRRTLANNNAATARNADALVAKADAFVAQGALDTAIQTYRKALAADPKNKDAAQGLSEVLAAKGEQAANAGNHAQAINSFQEAVKFDASNIVAYVGLGEIYDTLDQRENAITNFEKALQLDAALTDVNYPLGVLYVEAKNYPKAQTYLSRTMPARAEDAEAQNYVGLVASNTGREQEAVAAFQKAFKLKPDYAEAYFNLGETYDRMNRVEDAIAAYQQALKVKPDYAEALYNIGVAYYNRERYPEAADAYQKVIALKRDDLDAQKNLADTYRQMQQFDKAVGTYENVIAMNKNEPAQERSEVYSKYGYCAGKANQTDKAVAALNESVALNNGGDSVDYANLSWGYNNAAKADLKAKKEAESKQKFAEAKKAAQRGTEIDQKNEAAHFNLGNASAHLGEEEVAINAFKTAVALRSNWAEGYNGLGMTYRLFGDFKNAESVLSQALRINDNFADAHANMAIALMGLNKKKEAKKHQDRVKELNPKMALVLDALMKDISKTLIREGVRRIPGTNKIPGINRLPF